MIDLEIHINDKFVTEKISKKKLTLLEASLMVLKLEKIKQEILEIEFENMCEIEDTNYCDEE